MSTNDVINWSSGYDAGFEEGVKSAFLSLADRDMSDKEEEAWCEGFIKAWNLQAWLHPVPVVAHICATCDYYGSQGCAKKDHASIGCADWMIMDD